MNKSVVALYRNMQHARECVQDLVDHGFDSNQISLIANDPQGEYKKILDSHTGTDEVLSGAGKGAGAGAMLGGLAGLLVGLGALAIPGVGPIVAAGPVASALAGMGIGAATGAATGGLVAALANLGIPEEQAGLFAESIQRGSILVSVLVPDHRVNEAIDIMNQHNPLDTAERSREWMAGQPSRVEMSGQPSGTAYRRSEDIDDFEPVWRSHFQTTYSGTGSSYDDFAPAYRFGHELFISDRFQNRPWSEVEQEIRMDFQRRYPDQRWDRYREAVRQGFTASLSRR